MWGLGLRETILRQIETHLRKSGKTRSQFGVEAVGDREFVSDLAAGRNVRFDRIERAHDFIQRKSAPPDRPRSSRSTR